MPRFKLFKTKKKTFTPIVPKKSKKQKKSEKKAATEAKLARINADDVLAVTNLYGLIKQTKGKTAEKAGPINKKINQKLEMPLNIFPGFETLPHHVKVGDFVSKKMIKNLKKKQRISKRSLKRFGKTQRKKEQRMEEIDEKIKEQLILTEKKKELAKKRKRQRLELRDYWH